MGEMWGRRGVCGVLLIGSIFANFGSWSRFGIVVLVIVIVLDCVKSANQPSLISNSWSEMPLGSTGAAIENENDEDEND
jgi:hypothetical protein